MNTTENYNLNKPESSEQFDISTFNTNVDIIDNALSMKADASNVYTKSEVDTALEAINQMKIKLVQSLPTSDIDTHTIYYVPKTNIGTNDIYDEYIYIDSNWEMIGHTQVDLSEYIKSSDVLSTINTSSNAPVNSTAVNNAVEALKAIIPSVKNGSSTVNTLTFTLSGSTLSITTS